MDNLEKELSQIEPMLILTDRSPDRVPSKVESTTLTQGDRDQLFFFLVRQEDAKDVLTREVPTQRFWVIDGMFSPVVEFTRCSLTKETIRSGRLYFNASYYDAGKKLIKKSPEFNEWAKNVLSITRKLFRYDRELFAYVGPEAENMRREGAKFL